MPDPAADVEPDGWGTSTVAVRVAWAALALVYLVVAASVLRSDFRNRSLAGDTASFVLQAASLAYDGHNLSYDQADIDRFQGLRWKDEQVPRGAHVQRNDEGWAFAKPYGYSTYLAPFLRVFSPGTAVAVANLGLLTVILATSVAVLWLRYRGAVVPLVAGAFSFASHVFFYSYHAWTELFLAALVGATVAALLWALHRRSLPLTLVGVALAAFAVSEKAPIVVVLAPIVLVAIMSLPAWRTRALAVGVGLTAVVVSVFPYLYYSDFSAFNPYGGERYYIATAAPFGAGAAEGEGYYPVGTDETFSVSFLADNLFDEPGNTAQSALYYLVGRNTGLLVCQPLALAILALALVRFRSGTWPGWALLGGVLGYIAFYVLLFPENYYGGGQSLGNRYFLQISPAVLGIAVGARLRAKELAAAAALAILLAFSLLTQHYRNPAAALHEIWISNPRQRWLPFETNQQYKQMFGEW